LLITAIVEQKAVELRSANLSAITVAAASQARDAVAITAQSTRAAQEGLTPQSILVAHPENPNHVALGDLDLAVVEIFVVVAVDSIPEEDQDLISEDGEEAAGLQRTTAAPQRSTAVLPRSTHALDPRDTAAHLSEEEDFASHALATSREEKLSLSLRATESNARSTLTSTVPNH
jgi:hypothetical protein